MGIGGTLELPEGLTDSARIAGTSVPQAVLTSDTTETPSVALADAEGFIGTEILRRFAVTLDYAHGRAVFEPNALVRTPFCRNSAGLCVRPDPVLTGTEVVFVDPTSAAARAGIRVGYVILAVDGMPVAQLTAADVDRLLERAPGSVLEVVRNTAQLRAVTRPDVGTSRSPAARRAPVRERTGELIRLPNP
jgi:predicted metalloprotease with PDZ domain